MAVGPPRWVEALLRWLLPPQSRENVLGDLYERWRAADPAQAARQYWRDALRTAPYVIWSQLWRTFDLRLACAQSLAVYASFVSAALLVLGAPAYEFFGEQHGVLRIGVITLGTMVSLLLSDTYLGPRWGGRWRWSWIPFGLPWKIALAELLRVCIPFSATLLLHGVVTGFLQALAVPGPVVVRGGGLALAALTTVRVLIAAYLEDEGTTR